MSDPAPTPPPAAAEPDAGTKGTPAPPPEKDKAKSGKGPARAPLLKDKADQKPEHEPMTVPRNLSTGNPAQKADNPRNPRAGRRLVLWLFGLLLAVNVAAVAGGWWLYQEVILPKLTAKAAAPTIVSTSSAPPIIMADTKGLEDSLEAARAQITTLQRQIDAQREEREKTQARLQEMSDRMALVIKQSSFIPTADAARVNTDASQVAAMLPSVSPSTSELILLKERNRLFDYGDKAIATGSRDALQAIVDTMADPAMKNLNNAARAEYRRVVQAYYDMSIDPGYTLPVQEMFKDSAAVTEADLTPAQLTGVLQDPKQPWEARLRSAYLLRGSSDPDTDSVLLKAIKEDPSLDVAKEAQSAFEKRVGRKFRLFDIPSIDAWWQAQKGK